MKMMTHFWSLLVPLPFTGIATPVIRKMPEGSTEMSKTSYMPLCSTQEHSRDLKDAGSEYPSH
ncbi:hypothetical protein PGT21_036712 [Puccinia graminis f. sp. tritici]|uniref:Uncharacterized protein n=1 Tax=Puccinia graminis f. sp. tritici TaxID=56615 RepID=A0A5B0NR24_PUCGR|nr:hypothetical protein PGT21_036712 [Puccinia graminis f. sp. tritici]